MLGVIVLIYKMFSFEFNGQVLKIVKIHSLLITMYDCSLDIIFILQRSIYVVFQRGKLIFPNLVFLVIWLVHVHDLVLKYCLEQRDKN